MLDSVRGLSTFADIYQPSTSGGGLYATLISTVAELSYIVAGFSLLRIASSWPAFPSQCTSSLKLISTVIQNNYAILFEYFGILQLYELVSDWGYFEDSAWCNILNFQVANK